MGHTTGFLTKSLTATAAIPARRIVSYGPADGTGVPANGSAAALVGVSSELATDIGQRASVHMIGNIADTEYGGNVSRGDPITADAQGRAIVATAAGQRCVGQAEVSGVLGDIGSVAVAPFIF
jgi:hypothetical protein